MVSPQKGSWRQPAQRPLFDLEQTMTAENHSPPARSLRRTQCTNLWVVYNCALSKLRGFRLLPFQQFFSIVPACPQQGIKNATGLCYPWRCPGRWPVCIQLYGHGAEVPIDGCCTHISAFRGLSVCQGSLNSSKIVANEVVLTCLKCPWIQCFQGIIRFRLDF